MTTTDPTLASCQCEHHHHFDGGTCHAYGAKFNEETDLVEMPTDFGIFLVCTNCASDHLAEYRR